ncbi:protein SMAX1-LIKE 6-like [Salvia miltiorrhiza]|uniref:protein SMAX1-LIKE 6-like n=1 Tax=Salvia miltiorrhiza TaxID=226208 RepID=UPI0025AD3521|nr:protein SMAX1-LIKE 6-like [Salvia miltiorrhiza]
MPTPVGVARQCLSDSAAAVLDDAVAAARRRSHAQTTTLHVVSALLAVTSSPLREACTRAWSSAYSPRLQFRALELCVGVALDRVSASKSAAADEPPVSNSLMAAIKRSQASQRRHPDTFHLYQQQLNSGSQNTQSISAVKVELKHFLTSILDDPIVSRVFGDAGFRTQEIKMAVLNPLSISRFAVTASRPPPLFACSPDNFELDRRAHSFPFIDAAAMEKHDENHRKIREVLLKKTRRNPLLIGASGGDAYRNFLDCLKKGESGVLPKELDGLTVLSIEREISECIGERLSEAMIGLKFKKVDELVENCQGAGIIANCGDLKEFSDVELLEFVRNVVLKLKRLLIKHGGKLWLMGFLADDDDYKKLVEQFPCIEMDLDLHLLPITASSIGGKPFKSSLMRSFVPFGGFFSMSSELKSPCTNVTKTMKLCSSCNEKYEKEVSDVQKGVSTDSVADKQSVNLSSWLQIAECETSKKSCTEEAKKDKTILDARILALQRKWSGICQRLHHSWTSQVDTTLTKPHTFVATTLQHVPIRKEAVSAGSLSGGNNVTNMSPCMPPDWQKNSPPKQNVPRPAEFSASVIAQAEVPAQGLGLNDFQKSSSSKQRTSLPIACTFSPSVASVATDLTLGTFCDSSEEFRRNPSLQDDCSGLQNSESSMSQLSQSSPCSHHHGKQMYAKDLEHQWGVLAEKVYWQSEAIQTIGRTVSHCKNENARYHCSKKRNVWLSFVGPDKVGKRKIAASVAEIAFGRKDHLLYLDLCAEGTDPFDYIVDSYDSKYLKMQPGRELIVDYLAGELSKHPDSVVLLENVEKADFVVRCSLSQAIKTGKFPDSRGRPIYLNNNIFILASTVVKGSKHLLFGKEAPDFPEETILEAKNMQMQILVEPLGDIYSRNSTTRVSLFPSEIISNKFCSSKRKLMNDGSTKGEISKRACQLSRSFDLNLPVDGGEEDSDMDKSDDDYSDDSEVWLGELLEHVDENVVSKPFDFDSLSQKILREIDARLRKIVGATVLLEIDRQVMVQILAAAWLTERGEALEDWIEQVLCSGIDEARKRCNVASDFVLRLVPCEGLVVKAQASRVCLPAKINV